MTNINILIVEDDPVSAIKLRYELEDLGYSVIDIVDNADDAIAAFYATEPDLVILDIFLKGSDDGINIAERIQQDEEQVKPIIYLTADKSYHTFERAKSTNPSAFLIKPFDKYSIQYSIELALVQFYNPSNSNSSSNFSEGILDKESLYIKKQKKVVKVPITSILYIEVESKYSMLYTADGKFLLRISLKDLQKKLPNNLFLKVHRNYLVNIDKIVEFDFDDYTVKVANKEIPVGRRFKHEISEQLMLLS